MAEKKTDEEKLDDKLQKEAKEKSEARVKIIDDIVAMLRKELDKGLDFGGLQSIINEVQTKMAAFQVVAAGAEYGPSPMQMEELKENKLPVIAEPLPDGTPAANIAQASKEPEPKKATSKK